MVEELNEVYEREIQLRFELALEPWQAPRDASSPDQVLEALRRIEPPSRGVLLALAPSRPGRLRSVLRSEPYGLAAQLGQHAVVSCGRESDLRTVTIIHEIGHLLGAVHVADRSSIMYPVAEFDARLFDELNRKILRVAREREFGEFPDPELRAELRALYESPQAEQQGAAQSDLRAALRAVRSVEP
jgi:hypothetical protein